MSALKDRLSEALRDAPGKVRKTDLWRAARVSSGAVTQWFDGSVKSMAWEHAQKIAPVLGVSAQWLYDGHGPKYPTQAEISDGSVAPVTDLDQSSPPQAKAAPVPSSSITYDVVRSAVAGVLQALGVRYEDLVEDEGAARLRIEAALQGASKPAASARPAREIDIKKLDAKWVRNENEAMIPRQREAGRKKKPA